MHKLALYLAALLLGSALSACGEIHGVNSAGAANLVQGQPGTSNDIATGGQGNNRGDAAGGGGGMGRN